MAKGRNEGNAAQRCMQKTGRGGRNTGWNLDGRTKEQKGGKWMRAKGVKRRAGEQRRPLPDSRCTSDEPSQRGKGNFFSLSELTPSALSHVSLARLLPPPPQIFFSCHPDTQNTLYIVAITSQKQCYFWCSLVGEYTHTQCERDRSVSSQSQKPPKRAVVHQQGRKTSLASQVFGYIRKKLIVGVQHTVNATILACKTTGALKLGFFTL